MTPINFCPRCGHAVEDQVRFGKLRRVCPHCEYIHFDDPKVATAAFIEKLNNGVPCVLLVQRAVDPQKGLWALPAGFVDRGEDPKVALIREVAEETGLRVEVSGLLDVYFNASSTIAIVYEARVLGGVLLAQDDAADARWFSPEQLPPLAFESTQQLVTAWISRTNRI